MNMNETKTIERLLAEPMEEEEKDEFETVGMDGQRFREMQVEFWPLDLIGIELNVIVPEKVPEAKRREPYAKLEAAFKEAGKPIVREWAKSKA